MESCDMQKGASVLCYVCRLYFPNYPPYYFPTYMLFRYNFIRKRKKSFELVPLPYEAVEKLLRRHGPPWNDDANNAIIISQSFLSGLSIAEDCARVASKPAHLIGACVPDGLVYVSDALFANRGVARAVLDFAPSTDLPVATEIDLSVVNSGHDLADALVDGLVKNYLRTRKIVCVGDCVTIDFKKYAPDYYYVRGKPHGLKFVHLRCNRLLANDRPVEFAFCLLDKLTIKQSADVQSYIPSIPKRFVDAEGDDYESWTIDGCPYGLQVYAERLSRAIRPFLKGNLSKLRPAFLLQGNRGCGKSAIVEAVASSLGLHLLATTSGEIGASVYAQTESKLRQLFFKAKLGAPCVLHLRGFENFGKNNEGLYDDRIVSFFGTELDELFANNKFPVILVCTSDAKDMPAALARQFLETFEIATPSTAQKGDNLRWIVRSLNLDCSANLDDVAEKTHSFVMGDLLALVFYARRNALTDNRKALSQSDFDLALDRMQANYSQSLGAPKIPKVQWSDVGGLGDVKHEIIRTINLPLQRPELLRSTGLKRSGILLYGPPGTGKTLIAKAVATECNLCFLSVKGPELLNMYVGQSEQNVREVFERARDAAPCIVFFDELDSLAPNRGISGDSGGVMDRVVSQLLAEMDGLNRTATVFVIGATNRPDLIDPALLRPGRFDKLLYVGPCTDEESKIGVLKALTRRFKLDNVDLGKIVGMCPADVTGADFYGLCSLAWSSCVRRLIETHTDDVLRTLSADDVVVTLSDFRTALTGLKPSIKKEDLEYFNRLQREYTAESQTKKNINV